MGVMEMVRVSEFFEFDAKMLPKFIGSVLHPLLVNNSSNSPSRMAKGER